MLVETWKPLCGDNVRGFLEGLRSSGELGSDFPELQALYGFGGGSQGHKDLWDHTIRVTQAAKPTPEARLAALWHDTGKPSSFSREHGKVTFHLHEGLSAKYFRDTMRRTGVFTGPSVALVSQVIYYLGYVESYEGDWTDSAVRRLRVDIGDQVFLAAVDLARVDVTSRHESNRIRVQQRMDDLLKRSAEIVAQDSVKSPLPKGLGQSVMQAFGLKPSPKVGSLLKYLEAAVENGLLEPQQGDLYYVEYLKVNLDDLGL